MKPLLYSLFILTSPSLWAVKGDFVKNKAQLRAQYAGLYDLPVITGPNGVKTFHQGMVFKRHGVSILSLKGDSFEMAFQHGRLLREESKRGALIPASQMVNNSLRSNFSHRPVFLKLAQNHVDNRYTTAFLKNAIKEYPQLSQAVLERLFAVSEASDIPMDTLLDASLNPSVMMMLANSKTAGKEEEQDYAHHYFSSCTSFMAAGPYTRDGHMLIGRNTDYPLSGGFEKESAVIYFEPTDGRQKFMSIISAGLHTASVTAINEKGIYLGTHSLPSSQTGLHGTPMILWIHDVIGRSHSLDEAISLLTSRQFGVGWTFVLASAQENRVVSVEVDQSGHGLREWQNQKHVQTNHYLTPEMAPNMLHFNRSTFEETHNRFNRTSSLMEAAKGTLDLNSAIRILGDHTDTFSGQSQGFPNNTGATTTVSSIVYEPFKNTVWVATGLAPVPHNLYLALPTPQTFNPKALSSQSLLTHQNDWFQKEDPQGLLALRAYIQAKEAFEYSGDLNRVNHYLERATLYSPKLGHYWLMRGLLMIRSQNNSQAKVFLNHSLDLALSNHARALAHYYLGRIYGAEKNAPLGLKHLQESLKIGVDENLKEAAQKVYERLSQTGRYKLSWFEVIPLFQFGDVQKYL